ncbi:RNA-binding protein 44 [Erinaceus europaeus]|uniref:RNA-binding protein 44 n=1 Tax=Erinaceus europaeus TaxID=9365 RepID=A0ABM3WU54_ERIEU|nr:RNA-binding protein 44 [Erinaceus europaeus]
MRQSEQPTDCLLPGTLGLAWAYVLNSDRLHRGLSSASTKKELGSVLFSILRDVEVRYVSLKAKLSEGAALSELPPLSIESTLLSAFSEFVSKLMKEDSQIVSGADSERAHQGTRDGGDADFSPGLRKTFSRISLAADSYEPRQPPPPKEGVLGNIDVDIDLSQLRLGEQGHKAAPEVSEDWFDARESLTGTDFPGAQQSVLEPARGEPEPEPEPTRGWFSRATGSSACCPLCASGLDPLLPARPILRCPSAPSTPRPRCPSAPSTPRPALPLCSQHTPSRADPLLPAHPVPTPRPALTLCSQHAPSALTLCSQHAPSALTLCSQHALSALPLCSQHALSALPLCSQHAPSRAGPLLQAMRRLGDRPGALGLDGGGGLLCRHSEAGAGAPAGEPVRGDRGHATHAIHVGGLGPTISEADLRAHFQKYQVCTVSICDSPAYRFATLTLKRSGDARAAAREMNGASVGGRPVNVRLLKSPGEPNPAPPCGKGSRTHPRQPEEGRGPRAAAPPPGPPRTRPRRPAEPDLEQGPKKSCRQVPSAQLLPESPAHHLPANTLDLRSFTRILRRLAELHPGGRHDKCPAGGEAESQGFSPRPTHQHHRGHDFLRLEEPCFRLGPSGAVEVRGLSSALTVVGASGQSGESAHRFGAAQAHVWPGPGPGTGGLCCSRENGENATVSLPQSGRRELAERGRLADLSRALPSTLSSSLLVVLPRGLDRKLPGCPVLSCPEGGRPRVWTGLGSRKRGRLPLLPGAPRTLSSTGNARVSPAPWILRGGVCTEQGGPCLGSFRLLGSRGDYGGGHGGQRVTSGIQEGSSGITMSVTKNKGVFFKTTVGPETRHEG